jgi:hypothetical protein
VIDLTYADRLHKTIERKIRLRRAFTSPGLIEDNEREIRKAQDALRSAEEAEARQLPPVQAAMCGYTVPRPAQRPRRPPAPR